MTTQEPWQSDVKNEAFSDFKKYVQFPPHFFYSPFHTNNINIQ